jgi:hypothetical protein
MKVVINEAIGGFRPSELAIISYFEKKGFTQLTAPDNNRFHNVLYYKDPSGEEGDIYCYRDIIRHDPIFVEIVENLKELANSDVCRLKIVDIPDGVEYIICENEMGAEWIAEKHRTWD